MGRTRQGLALATMIVIAVVALAGFLALAGSVQVEGAARTQGRLGDLRAVSGVADSALAEATAAMEAGAGSSWERALAGVLAGSTPDGSALGRVLRYARGSCWRKRAWPSRWTRSRWRWSAPGATRTGLPWRSSSWWSP